MKFIYRPQLTWFSCGAACVEMLLASRGFFISHIRSIRETGCFPRGTTTQKMGLAIKSLSGGKLRLSRAMKPSTSSRGINLMMLATYSLKSTGDHVVIITQTRWKNKKLQFLVLDPLPWNCGWKNSKEFKQEEFFELKRCR